MKINATQNTELSNRVQELEYKLISAQNDLKLKELGAQKISSELNMIKNLKETKERDFNQIIEQLGEKNKKLQELNVAEAIKIDG